MSEESAARPLMEIPHPQQIPAELGRVGLDFQVAMNRRLVGGGGIGWRNIATERKRRDSAGWPPLSSG